MPPSFEKKKILVMDDEPEMQIFLTNLLLTAGFQPILAESGMDPVKQIIEVHPDLIIICVVKYRDSKIRLYRELKSDDALKRIPVMMLSNIDRKTFFHHHKLKNPPHGGALPEPDAYLVKPPEAEELMQLLVELTRISSPRIEEEKV